MFTFKTTELRHLLSFVGTDSNISVMSFGSLRRNAIIKAGSNKYLKNKYKNTNIILLI